MSFRAFAPLFVLVLLSSAFAQGEKEATPAPWVPEPAPQMEKLARYAGHWQGKGEAFGEAGGTPQNWTCRIVSKMALGGHWLHERMRIEFGEGQTGLQYESYTGWSEAHGKYVSLMFDNMGQVDRSWVRIDDEGRFVTGNVQFAEGKLIVSQAIAHYQGEECKLEMTQSVDGDEPFVTVRGTYRKVEPFELELKDEMFPFAAPVTELEGLAAMAGKYRLQGTWRMGPESQPMPIAGTESVTRRFGGALLHFDSLGDAMPGTDYRYRGVGVLSWDPKQKRYRMIFVNNMGESDLMEGIFDLEKRQLCLFGSGPMLNTLAARRSTLQLAEKGSMQSSEDRVLLGSSAPFVSFDCKYEKQ